MTTHPHGYNTTMVTLDRLREIHAPKMHPEFARRLFLWLADHPGIGIGGGFRTAPAPGGAPLDKSFHYYQTFASGIVAYAAVDLVVAVAGKVHRAPTWAETADAPSYGLHTFILNPPEPWHMQPIEIRGWQSWVNAGRPDPQPPPPPPPDPPVEETDMLEYILIPQGPAAVKSWWPWLACYTNGAVRPLGPVGHDTVPNHAITDLGQYQRICHAAGIQLVTEHP